MKPIKIIILIVFVAFIGVTAYQLSGQNNTPPRAVKGILDLTGWDLQTDGSVALQGEWVFQGNKFSEALKTNRGEDSGPSKYIKVPGTWNEQPGFQSKSYPAFGHGTYSLTVLIGQMRPRIGFRFLDQSSSFSFFVNGKKLFSSGMPGSAREKMRPSYRTGVAEYKPDTDTIELTLWVSNFHHWQGGAWEPIIIGPYEKISQRWSFDNSVSILLFGALALIGIYHLALAVIVKRNSAPLWFGVFSILISTRLLTTGERPIYFIFPDLEWSGLIRIIYIYLYLAIPAFTAYIKALFPDEVDDRFLWGQSIVCGLFALSALFLPPWVFSRGMPIFQIIILISMIYGLYAIILALKRKQQGSNLILFSFAVLFGASINDILISRDLIQSIYVVPYGVLVFVFTQTLIIARRFNSAFLTIEDQRGKLTESNLAIRESEERFSSLLKSMSDAVWVAEIDGSTVQYVNRAAEMLYGKHRSELLQNPDFWLEAVHPDDRARASKQADRALDLGRGEFEYRIIRPDGDERWLQDQRFLVYDEEGRPIRIGSIVSDVSGQKEAEDTRDKLEQQLRQAQKMEAVGTLAGGIAHDFNNLLGAIFGFGELAQLENRKKHMESPYIGQILNAAERGKELVKQILAFSRKTETNRKPLDLNQLITSSVKMLEHTIPKMIEIRMSLAGNLDPVLGDANQLNHVIMNLANNACDAMSEGGTLVFETKTYYLEQTSYHYDLEIPPGNYIVLSVSDTGSGIDGQLLNQIFDPFFTTKDVGKGTGLGLSTAYGIIKEHGGKISCLSELDRGTTFEVYLPSVDKEEASTAAAPPRTDDESPAGTEKILLVDDEHPIRELATEILKGKGYQVLQAGSGEEAIELLGDRGGEVDLVILDLGMPGMGGVKCLEEISKSDHNHKILIASGYSPESVIDDLLKIGASGYIAKPFRRSELLHTIREILD